MSRNLYITGTRRGDGKTTITVGLTSVIKRKVPNIGFIKPLGSRDIDRVGYSLDEDTLLVHKACDVHSSIQDASPITIRRGFPTSDLLSTPTEELLERIDAAFSRISNGRDLVIIEGAGHAAVGSMFGISNALVAHRLGAKALLVSSGRGGHPVDEIALNLSFFQQHDVEILGVVLNQVPPSSLDDFKKATELLLEPHGIRVLGAIPKFRFLSFPSLLQIIEALDGSVLAARRHMGNRFKKILLGAMSARSAFPRLLKINEECLLITAGDRVDMILAALQAHRIRLDEEGKPLLSGLVLTGSLTPDEGTLATLDRAGVPTIAVDVDSYRATRRIHDLEAQINPSDRKTLDKISQAIERYVDIETLLELL